MLVDIFFPESTKLFLCCLKISSGCTERVETHQTLCASFLFKIPLNVIYDKIAYRTNKKKELLQEAALQKQEKKQLNYAELHKFVHNS